MNRPATLPVLCVVLLCGLLSGCGKAAPDDDEAAAPAGAVAVTTTVPVQQTFHDSIEAWGSAAGDPQRARSISLGHGGQVSALQVAAGQSVKRGQPLLTITPDPVARSAYQQAQTTLSLATGELARTEQLASQRLATQSQLATARKALADAQSALAAQRALGGDAATETIDAPTDGVVTGLQVGLGERVAANAPLLSFTPTHALLAVLGVQPEDGARQTFAGTLRMVGQSIDPQTHLLNAQVELPATASASLVAGAPLDAQIRTADFTAWSVPRAAVLHDEHGDYLFQLEQGHAKRVNVKLRSAQGDPVGVDGPLDAKAKIIVLGVYELNDGDAVRESAK
jgi:RND family efflux transporter MFP subunit